VAEEPTQMLAGEVAALITGALFTETVTTAVLPQPFALDPVTVYVVFTLGVTITFEPVMMPGSQTYEVAPVAVKLTCDPAHTTVGEADAVTDGTGLTVIVIVVLLVQTPFAPVNV
jgi:hypothetical protein